jgi:hypothetical protein
LFVVSSSSHFSINSALKVLSDAGARLNVPNRLGICPVDAAKSVAASWLRDRGFAPNADMVQLLSQQEAMEKETLATGETCAGCCCCLLLSSISFAQITISGSARAIVRRALCADMEFV